MEEFAPDLGLEWWNAGHVERRFALTRVALYSIGRVADDTFTTTVNVTLERVFAITFDFGPSELELLLSLMSPQLAADLRARLTAPFEEPVVIEIPRLFVNVMARLGEPQTNEDETYVPLLVESFAAPSADASINIAAR